MFKSQDPEKEKGLDVSCLETREKKKIRLLRMFLLFDGHFEIASGQGSLKFLTSPKQ